MALTLTSSTFATDVSVPAQYTCAGDNVSPPLAWSGYRRAPRSWSCLSKILTAGEAPRVKRTGQFP
jgi:hypothetical protein